MIRKLMMAVPAVLLAAGLTLADKKDDGFVTISNGKDFSGWKASENKDSWSMKDGALLLPGLVATCSIRQTNHLPTSN